MTESRKYSLWIEAEEWTEGEWNPADDNTDVIVAFADGSRWVATFFSYANVHTLTEKNRQTGECLAGAYFWASDMILVEEVSRAQIEPVVADLIKTRGFELVFMRLPDAKVDE